MLITTMLGLLHRGVWFTASNFAWADNATKTRLIVGAVAGMHWSTDEQWAREWALRHVELAPADRVHAVVSIADPGPAAVEDDLDVLREHGVDQYQDEPEVPLRLGTPLVVIKVAWWEQDPDDPVDGAWHEIPVRLTATAGAMLGKHAVADLTEFYLPGAMALSGREFEVLCQRVLDAEMGRKVKIDFDLLYAVHALDGAALWDSEVQRARIGWAVSGLNDVIALHECAHVLAGYRGIDDDHGPVWAAVFEDLLRRYSRLNFVAGANGSLPEGLRLEVKPNDRGVLAWLPGDQIQEIVTGPEVVVGEVVVGELNWTQDGMVSWVSVPYEELRRRGIASALWDLAKTVEPRLRHSEDRSESGDAWGQRTAEANGDLPEGLTFRYDGDRILFVDLPDQQGIGSLVWDRDTHEVASIRVDLGWRRRGIADAMYRKAKEIVSDLHHGTNFTSDGRAWSQHTAARSRWSPAADLAWERVSTPSGERYRRREPENGLHPEVTKIRGSSAGTWYRGSAYDPSTGYTHRQESGAALDGWTWDDALAAALSAVAGSLPDDTVAEARLGPARLGLARLGVAGMDRTSMPAWRDRGALPEGYDAVIKPDTGRSSRNFFEVLIYGQTEARFTRLDQAKVFVETIYGPVQWKRVPGDQEPHWDDVHGNTTEFNDSAYFLVVEHLPRFAPLVAVGSARIERVRILQRNLKDLMAEAREQGIEQDILAQAFFGNGSLKGSYLSIARDSQGIAGVIDYDPRDGSVYNVRVLERVRRQGVGVAMMADIAQHVLESGRREMNVYNVIGTARSWYVHCGASMREGSAMASWDEQALRALASGRPVPGEDLSSAERAKREQAYYRRQRELDAQDKPLMGDVEYEEFMSGARTAVQGMRAKASLTTLAYGIYQADIYLNQKAVRPVAKVFSTLDDATVLVRQILMDVGFPDADEAYADRHPSGFGQSSVGWDMELATAGIIRPIVALAVDMQDELTVLHECAHIIRNGPSRRGSRGVADPEAGHDSAWMLCFYSLVQRYASPNMKTRFNVVFGNGRGGLSSRWAALHTASTWTPIPDPPGVTFMESGDAVPGGYNGSFVAYDKATGEKMGYIDYQSAGRFDVLIAMVEVEPKWRRKGVGTMLLQRLRSEFPEAEIDPGDYATPDGSAFLRTVQPLLRTATISSGPGERRAGGDMLDLYHRTTAEAADAIMRERKMTSKEYDGSIYFSTAQDGQAEGYGTAVVHVRVPETVAELDDEFPDGEQHYRVNANDLRPGWFVTGSLDDYGGRHQPQGPHDEDTEPIWNMGTVMMPPDVYERPENYPDGRDSEVRFTLRAAKGNPNALISIYRAMPQDDFTIESGNWVTISKAYARFHGESNNAGLRWHVIEARVKASDVYLGDGNSLAEYGYFGETIHAREISHSGSRDVSPLFSAPDLADGRVGHAELLGQRSAAVGAGSDLAHARLGKFGERSIDPARVTPLGHHVGAVFGVRTQEEVGGFAAQVGVTMVTDQQLALRDTYPEVEGKYMGAHSTLPFTSGQLSVATSVARLAGEHQASRDLVSFQERQQSLLGSEVRGDGRSTSHGSTSYWGPAVTQGIQVAAAAEVVRLYHGTNQASLDSIRRDGQLKAADHHTLANQVEERYRLPHDSIWDHPIYSFERGFRAYDAKVYFSPSSRTSLEYADIGSEAVFDAMGAAYALINAQQIEDMDGNFPPGRSQWIESETRKHYQPVLLTLDVPWSIVGPMVNQHAPLGQPQVTYRQFMDKSIAAWTTMSLPAPIPASYIVEVRLASTQLKTADADDEGVMVALVPPDAVNEALDALEATTEPLDDQHITVVYLGDTDEVDREALHQAVKAWASGSHPVDGKLTGFGTFDNDDEHVLHAAWQIQDGPEWRDGLKQALQAAGVDREDTYPMWTPHQTLAYADEPITTLPKMPEDMPREVVFGSVAVAYGGDWTIYPLGR